jgi:hypothetical protein
MTLLKVELWEELINCAGASVEGQVSGQLDGEIL